MAHRVLLVDDETGLTNGIRRALYRETFEIVTANSGNEALRIMREKPVDVIISDEMMPGMSGLELLKNVCKEFPQTVRIMLTGQATLDVAVRAINDGQIYRFLMKPCNVVDLAVTIRQALAQRELLEKSSLLLKMSQRQTDLLEEIGRSHEVMEAGERMAGVQHPDQDISSDIHTLIQNINAEVIRLEKLFLEWVSREQKPVSSGV